MSVPVATQIDGAGRPGRSGQVPAAAVGRPTTAAVPAEEPTGGPFPFDAGPFEWWTDDESRLWMRHRCSDGHIDSCRLPPPWRVENEAVTPSLHCIRCAAHVIVGPAERVAPMWNWMIPVAQLCGSCDGKGTPVADCEWCLGTGVAK